MANISLQDCAKVVGEDAVQKLIDAFPGGKIYLKRDFISTEQRNKALLDDFYSGQCDRRDLARIYSLSVSRVDQIIKAAYTKTQDIE